MPEVLIALGSNVGDRLENMRRAVGRLREEIEVLRASAVYETAPMYVTDQPAFYNAALLAQTELSPLAVLTLLKRTEAIVGRNAAPRNGPREIDLDLVGYGALAYRFTAGTRLKLQVPHPRTPERRFVLQPLADVAPDYSLPGIGRVLELFRQTEDQANTVHRIEDALLPL